MTYAEIIKQVVTELCDNEYIITSNNCETDENCRVLAIDCFNPLKCIVHIVKDSMLTLMNSQQEQNRCDINDIMSNTDDLAVFIMNDVKQEVTYEHSVPMTRVYFPSVLL